MAGKRVVVLLGSQDGGTSLAAQILQAMGVEFGSHSVSPPRGLSNEVFQHREIDRVVRAVEGLVEPIADARTSVLPLPEGWLERNGIAELCGHLCQIVQSEMTAADDKVWGFHNIRTIRLLPLWHQVFQRLDLQPLYVVAWREPAHAVNSLMQGRALRLQEAELLWLAQTADLIRYTNLDLAAVVSCKAWLSNPLGQARDLAEQIDGLPSLSDAELEQLLEPIFSASPEDSESVASRPSAKMESLTELSRKMAAIVGEAATAEEGDLPSIQQRAQGLVAEFDRLSLLFSSWAPPSQGAASHDSPYQGVRAPNPLIEHLEPRNIDCKTATFSGLPLFEGLLRPTRPLKVCIMTPDITGPVRNGGIGTAYRYASELLAAAGHEVTILYVLGSHSEQGPIEDWVKFYGDRGVTFVPMPNPEIPLDKSEVSRAVRFSYGGYLWLKDHDSFDLVHVSEWRGTGYFSMLAKKLGLAFANTVFCVKCSSPSMWNRQGGSTHIAVQQELATSYMERRSVELSDIIVSGSLHLLRWMLEHGYRLDRPRCHVQPNIMLGPEGPPAFARSLAAKAQGDRPAAAEVALPTPPDPGPGLSAAEEEKIKIDEIVFFGRLEPRKGIYIFCDAVARLAMQTLHPKKVVFLGKISKVFPAEDFIAEKSADWPFEVEVVSHLSQLEVADYLSQNNRLAVIPSLLENSSFAIYECLMHGIPFICANTGGSPELIHPDVRGDILFEAHPGDLHRRLHGILQEGLTPPRPSFDNDCNTLTWLNWHASLTQEGVINALSAAYPEPQGAATNAKKSGEGSAPLVSVCLNHFNRPKFVSEAIDSLKRQTHANLEVILVDDGSTRRDAQALLDRLEPDFASSGWRVIRQDNRYVGAARNRAAEEARGDFLLFMDDDMVALPEALATMVSVAERSQADILTCFANGVARRQKVEASTTPKFISPCLGPAAGYGFFANGYGGAFCLVRRKAFEALGGYSNAYKVSKQSEEFFARATLEGFKVEVIPLPLYWQRDAEGRAASLAYNHTGTTIAALQPYIDAAPFAYRNVLLFASSLQHQKSAQGGKGPGAAGSRQSPTNQGKNAHPKGQSLQAQGQNSSLSTRVLRRFRRAFSAQ